MVKILINNKIEKCGGTNSHKSLIAYDLAE